MDISRITKAIAEVRQDQKFQNAEDVRILDVDLFLPAELDETLRRMAQTAAALILRCFKGSLNVHFSGQDSALRSLLMAEAEKMDAHNQLNFNPTNAGRWCLALGCKMDGTLSADASGWMARINGIFMERKPAAAPAITFAVACTIAKLFNHAIFNVQKNISESWDFCLQCLSVNDGNIHNVVEPVDLGRIGLLGAGGIGSALGYVLSISGWSGKLDIIDFDHFEGPNLETCISANTRDVNLPLRKALSLQGIFQNEKIVATERNLKIQGGDTILQENWDAFVCGVDNPETRLVLDDVNANILLNAGLGSTKEDVGWAIWTQHGKDGVTLSSIYKNNSEETSVDTVNVPEEFRDECGRKSYRGVSLALPFVALAAGSLLAASLYQNAIKKRQSPAFLQIDLFGKQQRMTLR